MKRECRCRDCGEIFVRYAYQKTVRCEACRQKNAAKCPTNPTDSRGCDHTPEDIGYGNSQNHPHELIDLLKPLRENLNSQQQATISKLLDAIVELGTRGEFDKAIRTNEMLIEFLQSLMQESLY